MEAHERHFFGHSEFAHLVVGNVAVRHERAVAEVHRGKLVAREVEGLHVVGILQREVGEAVAGEGWRQS